MQSSDYWSVQAGNRNPSKTQNRLPYQPPHLNTADSWIWLPVPQSNPFTDSKKATKDNKHTHTRPLFVQLSNTHRLPFSIQRTRQRKEGWTCISFFACLRKGWTPVRQSTCRGYSLMPPKAFTHRSLERMAEWEWGGVKRKILANLLFIGRGFSFQGSFIEAFPNTSLSLSALTSANQRAWVQDFLGKHWRISETIANESTVTMA